MADRETNSSGILNYVKGKDSVPYWIAPKRDPPECNNDKAMVDDIWNFGICALELFHVGAPLNSLSKSEPLLEQNKEKIGLPDGYENYITNPKRLSDEFRKINIENNWLTRASCDRASQFQPSQTHTEPTHQNVETKDMVGRVP
ncbi:hypothetical protein CFP56_010876 [Quercus suber]|uniref:Protein kinase domain-containing protein n=1 Tax=Quercus suber TaxID=58331 RepID=A0AAW0KZS5_QUESU